MTEVLDAPALKALSIDTRQEIMKLLAERPYTSSELSKILSKHVTTVGEHLAVLENSGLVRRKESDHKWIYYILTEKGEKLFKPKFYSWIVVLSLSFIVLVAGMLQIFSRTFYAAAGTMAETATKVGSASTSQTPAAAPLLISDVWIGIILISLSMLGFGYLMGKRMGR